MKSKILRHLKLSILVFGLTLFMFNCQQEDDLEKQNQTSSVTQKSTTKTVSGKDIPEILNFIQSKSNSRMQFALDDSNSPEGQFRSHEDNLSLTTTLTDQIEQVTNNYGKSNYTFSLIEENTKEGVYFLNLVVKEYKDTFYLYIVKYVADDAWITSNSIYKDFGDFTGAVYFYSDDGSYLAKFDIVNGIPNSFEKHPCPGDDHDDHDDDDSSDDGSPGNGSGGGSTSDTGTSDGSTPSTGSSTGGDSGGGTGGEGIIVGWLCNWRAVLHEGPGHCNNPDAGGSWVFDFGGLGDKSMNNYLRHPCEDVPEECYEDNGDPCLYGCNVDENGCAEEPEENDEIAIMPDKVALSLIKNCVESVTDGQNEWLLNNSSALVSLGTFIDNNGCSPETQEFVERALETLMEGGEVDYDDNVILSAEFKNNEKLKCVYDKLAGDNSTLFRETIGAFIDNPNANLIFTIGECSQTDDACTQDNYIDETGIITIVIEDTDLSPVELAQLILHESIHAELALYVSEYESGINPNNRAQLFQLYQFYLESNVPEHHLDHPYMTLNYINPLASALREFDNNSYPLDYYKSFAWDGLTVWDVNNLLTDPLEDIYASYRPIVIQNSELCD